MGRELFKKSLESKDKFVADKYDMRVFPFPCDKKEAVAHLKELDKAGITDELEEKTQLKIMEDFEKIMEKIIFKPDEVEKVKKANLPEIFKKYTKTQVENLLKKYIEYVKNMTVSDNFLAEDDVYKKLREDIEIANNNFYYTNLDPFLDDTKKEFKPSNIMKKVSKYFKFDTVEGKEVKKLEEVKKNIFELGKTISRIKQSNDLPSPPVELLFNDMKRLETERVYLEKEISTNQTEYIISTGNYYYKYEKFDEETPIAKITIKNSRLNNTPETVKMDKCEIAKYFCTENSLVGKVGSLKRIVVEDKTEEIIRGGGDVKDFPVNSDYSKIKLNVEFNKYIFDFLSHLSLELEKIETGRPGLSRDKVRKLGAIKIFDENAQKIIDDAIESIRRTETATTEEERENKITILNNFMNSENLRKFTTTENFEYFVKNREKLLKEIDKFEEYNAAVAGGTFDYFLIDCVIYLNFHESIIYVTNILRKTFKDDPSPPILQIKKEIFKENSNHHFLELIKDDEDGGGGKNYTVISSSIIPVGGEGSGVKLFGGQTFDINFLEKIKDLNPEELKEKIDKFPSSEVSQKILSRVEEKIQKWRENMKN